MAASTSKKAKKAPAKATAAKAAVEKAAAAKSDGSVEGTAAPAGQASGQGGQDAGQQQPMQILAQYVKDFSFESPGLPESLRYRNTVNHNITIDLETRPLQQSDVEVTVMVTLTASKGDGSESQPEAKNQAEERVYIAEISYAGVVRVGPVPKQAVASLLSIEAPQILFPYARSILLTMVRDGGFISPQIPPVNFLVLARTKAERLKAQEKANGEKASGAKDN